MGTLKDPKTCTLQPAQARLARAKLAGFRVHTRHRGDGIWEASVTGELLLPNGNGKNTKTYTKASRIPNVAGDLATNALLQDYQVGEVEPAPGPAPLAG